MTDQLKPPLEMRCTPRQEEILRLVASGLSDKEIASRLGVSPRTVQSHLDRLYLHYGFHKRTAAVAAWLHWHPDWETGAKAPPPN